ncbi:MAG: AMP-binding protein [Anaerolineales bacterium]|nr:AMP-binding protein [Anaerolineales bacterium]
MHTLAQRLWQNANDSPDRPAIYLLQAGQPDQTLTCRDLVRGGLDYTLALQQAGVQPGEVVILILQHGAPLIYSFWGAVLGGFIPAIMPFLTEKLSPEKYRRDLTALFEITRPAAVITYRAFEPEVRAAALNSSVRVILVAEAVAPAGADSVSLAGLTRSPEDIVVLQHSSGTTGLQKGVALAHRAVFSQLEAYSRAIRLTRDDVVVSWLPLYHDMGLIAGFILPVLTRTPLVLMSPFDWVRAPYKLMHAVSRYRGTLSWLPNFAYNFCAQKIRDRDLDGIDLSSWRAISNCSEPMRWESHRMFAERFTPYGLRPEALATCYAMAENVFAVSQGGIESPVTVDVIEAPAFFSERRAVPASPEAPNVLRLLSAGRPLENTRVRILDDQRRELPERCIGEIALQGDCLLTGFYNRPDLTAQAFHDGWYLTGDLGYLANGEVYVTGRKKDLIIVGGKNIYPGDLEALAGEVPGVYPGRVAAFGVFDEVQGTEEVVIVAEAETQDEGERRRIADAIRERVTRGSEVAVRRVQVVGLRWLLKTSSGKIARAANREKFLREFGA